MERFTVLAFHNNCGKNMHVSYRTLLHRDRHKELEATLQLIEGVRRVHGSDIYTVSVEIAPSYSMAEVAPQVLFALASFLGQPLDEVQFSFQGHAVGIVDATPFVNAALEIFSNREKDGELELIARRIKLHTEAINTDLNRYDMLKSAGVA